MLHIPAPSLLHIANHVYSHIAIRPKLIPHPTPRTSPLICLTRNDAPSSACLLYWGPSRHKIACQQIDGEYCWLYVIHCSPYFHILSQHRWLNSQVLMLALMCSRWTSAVMGPRWSQVIGMVLSRCGMQVLLALSPTSANPLSANPFP